MPRTRSLNLPLSLSLTRSLTLDPDSKCTGLLGRPWRPSVAQSAWSFGGDGEGSDHADCASGGLPLSRESRSSARLPREPGSAIVRSALRRRMVDPAQWRTRHPAARVLPRSRNAMQPPVNAMDHAPGSALLNPILSTPFPCVARHLFAAKRNARHAPLNALSSYPQ